MIRHATAVAAVLAALCAQKAEPEQVPDPDWKPQVGEQVVLYLNGRDVPVAANPRDYDELAKLMTAGDQDGLRELEKTRRAGLEKSGTPVLILKVHIPDPPPRPFAGVYRGGEALSRAMQRQILNAPPAPPPPPPAMVELRILEGRSKGLKVFARVDSVARMITREELAARSPTLNADQLDAERAERLKEDKDQNKRLRAMVGRGAAVVTSPSHPVVIARDLLAIREYHKAGLESIRMRDASILEAAKQKGVKARTLMLCDVPAAAILEEREANVKVLDAQKEFVRVRTLAGRRPGTVGWMYGHLLSRDGIR